MYFFFVGQVAVVQIHWPLIQVETELWIIMVCIKIKFENFFCRYYILLKKIAKYCNILTFSKAFDSIPDF